jgi:hypothetical protein
VLPVAGEKLRPLSGACLAAGFNLNYRDEVEQRQIKNSTNDWWDLGEIARLTYCH